MDIIDILLARALTPEGQAAQAAAVAQQAARTASDAAEVASSAAEALTSAVEDIEGAIDSEVKKMSFDLSSQEFNDNDTRAAAMSGIRYDLDITYPDTTSTAVHDIVKLYYGTGENEDGAMTQKAVSDIFSEVYDTILELSSAIEDSAMGGFPQDQEGHLISIDSQGNAVSSSIREADVVNVLITTNNYYYDNVLGLEIDYANKTFKKTLGNEYQTSYSSFFPLAGRYRCNVADNGEIVAWGGDSNFKTDGSNGQVMVYQPKFYYKRIPITLNGNIIRKEIIVISSEPQPGFELHPLFVNSYSGQHVNYVLLPAFEGSAYLTSSSTYDLNDSNSVNFNTDKLSSIAGAKPISGVNKSFTLANAEKMATNRGAGWHITDMTFESAQQMLMAIEFGTLNMQSAIEAGIVDIPNNSGYNCASITGSTISLGDYTGHAESTVNEINGTTTTYTDAGRRAISYRGVENPWGNIWRMVGNARIIGEGNDHGGRFADQQRGGYLYFDLPNTSSWISGFGYNGVDYIFLPAECSNANSALPVGDSLWVTQNLNGTNMLLAGGAWSFGDSCGPFFYGADQAINAYGRAYSARLMYIPSPTYNPNIYYNNYNNWLETYNGRTIPK